MKIEDMKAMVDSMRVVAASVLSVTAYNENHDPDNGQFSEGDGGGSSISMNPEDADKYLKDNPHIMKEAHQMMEKEAAKSVPAFNAPSDVALTLTRHEGEKGKLQPFNHQVVYESIKHNLEQTWSSGPHGDWKKK